ncbi:sanguinarine reductase isoform X2 [Phalaenopsis equestris]|uniref:sanguinarine reductase isoform X2 n=1 Tax=Phalaenopsis equestris TaxID=78828 RepID=UPI0009E30B34|nr:sanguinarine reductase isoform X2 [Phalaenopsis equestris]
MALNLCPHLLQVLPVSSEKIQMGILRKASPLLISLKDLRGQSFHPLHSYSSGGGASVSDAVQEEQIQSYESAETDISETNPSTSKLVLVVGGTGGVGQLIVASLLKRNIKTRLLLREPAKAKSLFGVQDENSLKIWKGDTRNPDDLDSTIFEGVTHVICCTGTTAFPSRRWNGENTPERVDWDGVRNLASALPPTLKRIVLVSSVGVTKFHELPWRAGRLTDGPYTSYDLNTVLQATAGKRRAVVIGKGDKLVGEASRIVVAEACIQALDIEFTQGQIYEINSIEGEGPGNDPEKWRELFKAAEED